jgi:hypothetical protein
MNLLLLAGLFLKVRKGDKVAELETQISNKLFNFSAF